jgi:hypothetical protein
MKEAMLLTALALIASGFLFYRWRHYLSILAIVISAIETLRSFKIITFVIRGFPVSLILGGALTVVGCIILTRVKSKSLVIAATAITLIGAIQLGTGLIS